MGRHLRERPPEGLLRRRQDLEDGVEHCQSLRTGSGGTAMWYRACQKVQDLMSNTPGGGFSNARRNMESPSSFTVSAVSSQSPKVITCAANRKASSSHSSGVPHQNTRFATGTSARRASCGTEI